MFLGYETGSKACKCLGPITFKFYISRDVIFDESKSYNFDEHRNGRKISLFHSNILHVKGLEEPSRESTKASREMVVIKIYDNSAILVENPNHSTQFNVNGHRIKPYIELQNQDPDQIQF